MKKWLYIVFILAALSGTSEARNHGRGVNTIPLPAESAPPPSPVAVNQAETTPGSGPVKGSEIYIWTEKGVIHAVSDPADVPPRFSKRLPSREGSPQIIRMVSENPPPGDAKTAQSPVKGIESDKSRKHPRKKKPARIRVK